MVWTTIKRGLRHLFRLRWDMDLSTGRTGCPCCQGVGAHWLMAPTVKLENPYGLANVVNCVICQGTGLVLISVHYSYDTVRRGQCVTRD
jgi:hypothetical protein